MALRTFDISSGKPVEVAPGQVNPPAPSGIQTAQQQPQQQAQPQYSSFLDQVKASFGNSEAQKAIKNKPGLDLGDLASLVGQIPVVGGSILGGIAGTAAAPGLGSVAGAGAGAGAGEALRAGIGKLLGVQQGTTLGGEAKKIGQEALIGGATEGAGKALAAGAKLVKNVTPAFFSFTTGLPSQVFEKAIENPSAVRSGFGADIGSVIKVGQNGLQTAKKVAQEKYGQVFKTIADEVAASGEQASLKGAQDIAQTAMKDLGIKSGKVGKKYVISFNTSKIADTGEQNILKQVFEDVRKWPDKSFEGINTLSQRISNRITPELSAQTRRAITKVAEGVKDQLPEKLRTLNKTYAQHLDVLGALEGIFKPNANKTKALQQAETKLRQMFGPNKTQLQALIQSFESGTGANISDKTAGILLSRVQPNVLRGLSATQGSLGGVLGLGGYALGGIPGAAVSLLGGLASTSPRLTGEAVTGIARGAELLKPGIKKAAPYLKGVTMETLRRISQ